MGALDVVFQPLVSYQRSTPVAFASSVDREANPQPIPRLYSHSPGGGFESLLRRSNQSSNCILKKKKKENSK